MKKEYTIPSLENIRALYDEIIPMLKELKTKEDIIAFGEKHKVTMEINYDLATLYDESQSIEVIRCESWGNLDYIYVYTDESYKPVFDVWCDFSEHDFIDGIIIDELETAYKNGIQMLWHMNETRKEDLMEIISILRSHSVDYNYMIDTYGFDIEIVEEYENEHYEIGYGDIK